MSYKFEIKTPHEINRDLATILGNAAKTNWKLTSDDLISWLCIQKQMFPTWENLHAVDYDGTFVFYISEFAEETKEVCTINLFP